MKAINLPARCQVLDGAALKWIAMLSMLIDHVNKGILLNLIIVNNCYDPTLVLMSNLLEVLGRIAFPIFLFLLVEGFWHTKSKLHYFAYLMGFGVLAEIPYDMFESGVLFDWGAQNMYFTLALALLTLWAVDTVRQRFPRWGKAFTPFIALFFAYLASFLGLDYHYYGILIPLFFYLAKDSRLIGSIASYLIILKELWSILGFALVNLYNGKRGRINKWFCYAFYPVHLLIIGMVRIYCLKV